MKNSMNIKIAKTPVYLIKYEITFSLIFFSKSILSIDATEPRVTI